MIGRPKRVLHVIRAMDRGGVETWLMHVLRRLDPRRLRMDFLIHTDIPAAYDAEIVERGSRLLRCTVSWRSPAYGAAVRSLIRSFGVYDVIHSHVHFFSGILLAVTRQLQVPVRIAHSHCDAFPKDLAAGWLRRGYLRIARASMARHATHVVAASQTAGRALFGKQWATHPDCRVLHCGIDLEPFHRPSARAEIRAGLGICAEDVVIGHIGRFDMQKNHPFLVEIFAEAARRDPRLRLLLIGDGRDRGFIEERVRALDIGSRTIFLGSRPDVPSLLSAMDGFLFPSRFEGLGLALIEAQAAGLHCLVSDCVPEEADVVPELVQRLPLKAGVAAWADELRVLAANGRSDRQAGLAAVENSDFSIDKSLEGLYALYGA